MYYYQILYTVQNGMCCTFIKLIEQWVCLYQPRHKHVSNALWYNITMFISLANSDTSIRILRDHHYTYEFLLTTVLLNSVRQYVALTKTLLHQTIF